MTECADCGAELCSRCEGAGRLPQDLDECFACAGTGRHASPEEVRGRARASFRRQLALNGWRSQDGRGAWEVTDEELDEFALASLRSLADLSRRLNASFAEVAREAARFGEAYGRAVRRAFADPNARPPSG